MGIFPGISYWEKKKVKPEKNVFPRKRFLTVVTACQTAIQGEIETQTVVGQWWVSGGAGPHLEQGCLDAHILGLYLNFAATSGP